MKLLLFKDGETDAHKVKSITLANKSHPQTALVMLLETGHMAVLKFEDPGEVARLIEVLTKENET